MKEKNGKTALQWAQEGYVLNADAIGEECWTNCCHVRTSIYYKDTEVHEDAKAAKEVIKAKRKEYYQTRKTREEKMEKAFAIREKMKTEWQWLQEGRIPDKKAKWEVGESLNNVFDVCSYGSNYCYCHIDDTHLPENEEELQRAIEEYYKQ